jgi:cation diffusion facilitator family transporter
MTSVGSGGRERTRAAAVSIVSNTLLIALKLFAGAVTGSVAILTEAIHSGIDLIASCIAYFSVRQAEEPADAEHRYGHEKFENVAAAAEGVLILVGSGVIIYASAHALIQGTELQSLGFGIAVVAFASLVNLIVSAWLFRRAAETESAALEGDAAHLRTDAYTSLGVLLGLILVEVTGDPAFDAIAALVVAVAIVVAGLRIVGRSSRVLVDEALPPEELDRIEAAIAAHRVPEVAGYHKLRARRAGSHRHIDLHVQFRSGTSLERAHELSHGLRDAISAELPGADVLIHVEPETSLIEPSEAPQPFRAG